MKANQIVTSMFTAATTLSVAWLVGCAHATKVAEAPKANFWQDTSLSQGVAEWRANKISQVHYALEVEVEKTAARFSGEQKITFALNDISEDLPLDFQDGDITKLVVNDKEIKADRGALYVRLPKELLKVGTNVVDVAYTHEYSHTGAGLHRFEDPEDHEIYLYTQFEPFDANRWAPFFDQPDIKANLTLNVRAPADWKVISNWLGDSAKTGAVGKQAVRTWTFKETPPISTYLYAMVAGPFVEYHDKYKDMPLGLYARKRVAKYVDTKEWFKVTRQGLAFYEKFFGVNYAFAKYDQLIVPEFNAGAMENVGAITFSERYLRRAGYTRDDKLHISEVVLHEMAHQWFGDLVTMKWWNDLWLNESFATVMSALAQTQGTEYTEGWLSFQPDKIDAYWQDQLVITHPISGEVKNTNEAFTTFDDITYGKGASVLKELYYQVGDETFRKALGIYFQAHSYKNGTLADFIAAFNEATGKDMKPWFTAWLTTTGIDEVTSAFSCEGSKYSVSVTNLSLTPRTHIFKMGQYKLVGNKVKFLGEGRALTNGGTASMEVVSDQPKDCPDFVFANTDDIAYVKTRLDDKSIAFLKDHISEIEDPVTRVTLWQTLWQMVRDQKLKVGDFGAIAMKAFQVENNVSVLKYLAHHTFGYGGRNARDQFDSLYFFMPRETIAEKRALLDTQRNFAEIVWARLNHTPANSDLYKSLFDFYLASAEEPSQEEMVLTLLAKTKDQDRRWNALNTLCALGYDKCESRVSMESTRDPSDLGRKQALACRVVIPKEKIKQQYLSSLRADKSPYTADESTYVTRNLFPATQRNLLVDHAGEIYDSLHSTWLSKRDETVQERLVQSLAPLYCDAQANAKLKQELDANANVWPATMRIGLLERWDEDRRCISVRNFNHHL